MNQFNKILCPVNFSKTSENSVMYAVSFGKKFGIKPQILHVSTKPSDVYYRFFPDATGYLKAVDKDIQIQLKDFTQKIDRQLKKNIRYGTIYHEINQFAEDEKIDLIIIAAGEYSTSRKQILGTATQKVLRKANCPVLIVYGRRTEADIKRIMCPLDLSPRSYKGLQQAALLTRKFKAKLYILHVVELHEFEKRKTEKYSSDATFSKLSERLEKEIKIPKDVQDIEIKKVIRRNQDAAAEIVSFASKNKIDLITLTTHGRSYLPRTLLGSVTEKVAHIAPCPVLTVRVKKRRPW